MVHYPTHILAPPFGTEHLPGVNDGELLSYHVDSQYSHYFMYASYWGMWMQQRLASQPVFYHNGEQSSDQSLIIHDLSRLGEFFEHVALISVALLLSL